MSVPLSYLGVVLIWATTPLAIKWSGEGPGWLFGVAGRMALGALVALAVAAMAGQLRGDREARRTYLAAGLGIYLAMLCVYWGAQHIPSGWVSVIFGLTPMLTGIMAGLWLGGSSLTPLRVVGMLLGVCGLAVIFGRSLDLANGGLAGAAAVLTATLVHSASAVWVKRLGGGVSALATVSGSLAVAAPLFGLTWLLLDGQWPTNLPQRAATSILYLALAGSVVGFALYYYVLRHVDATRVGLITLMTPILALLLGHWFNGEPLGAGVWSGTSLVVGGLALFEFGDTLLRRVRSNSAL